MSSKEAVIEMIQRMPEDTSVQEIMAELFFRQQVDAGLRQLDAGEGIEHAEAMQRLSRWLD